MFLPSQKLMRYGSCQGNGKRGARWPESLAARQGDAVVGRDGRCNRLLLDGVEADWDLHHGEMGHDMNQGLAVVQFFRLRSDVPRSRGPADL